MNNEQSFTPEDPNWTSPTGAETVARFEELLHKSNDPETAATAILRQRHPEIELKLTDEFTAQLIGNKTLIPTARTWFGQQPYNDKTQERKALTGLSQRLLKAGPEARLFETTIGQQFLGQLTELVKDYSGDLVVGADGQRFWIPTFPVNAIAATEIVFREYLKSDAFRRTVGVSQDDGPQIAREFVRGCELHEFVEMTYRNLEPAIFLPGKEPKLATPWIMSEHEWHIFQGAREVLTNQVLYSKLQQPGVRLALLAGTISYLEAHPQATVGEILETLRQLVASHRKEEAIESRPRRNRETGDITLSLLPIRDSGSV